jgi:hypothetical protein
MWFSRPDNFPKRAWYAMLAIAVVLGLLGGYVGDRVWAAPEAPAVQSVYNGGGEARICHPRPPEYPGCTAQQVQERTSYKMAKRQYYNGRFGRTSKAQRQRMARRLTPGQVRTLKVMYRVAVRKYVRQHRAMGLGGDPYPPIRHWWGFYGGSGCLQTEGQNRNWGYMPTVYCHAGPETLETTVTVFRETGKVALVCAGSGLVVGGATAASAATFTGPAAGAAGLAAGSATTSACLTRAIGLYVIPDAWEFWN